MAFPDTVFDGDFDSPIAIEGGPLITTDEVTKSELITRFYAVKNSRYKPLEQGTPDSTFKDAYLINESPNSIQGPILFFQRNFGAIPESRTEPRTVPFTAPGRSSVDYNGFGEAIGWNQYGGGAPNTRNVVAQVDYSYAIDPDSFVRPPLTVIRIGTIAVDYLGPLYVYSGTVKVKDDLTEPRWTIGGLTNPAALPAIWIQEVNITRWRGPIWQMEVISLFPSS